MKLWRLSTNFWSIRIFFGIWDSPGNVMDCGHTDRPVFLKKGPQRLLLSHLQILERFLWTATAPLIFCILTVGLIYGRAPFFITPSSPCYYCGFLKALESRQSPVLPLRWHRGQTLTLGGSWTFAAYGRDMGCITSNLLQSSGSGEGCTMYPN